MNYKTFLWILCIFLCLSCGGKLYNIDHPYVERIDELKEFNATDFSTYVFNICEKFDSKTNYTERFCPCPENFYELKPTDSIKKIEEVYFMLNEPANLAIYVTTRSHKYISNSRRGFLNDPLQYKDKINLNQIEYIYIGNLDNTQNKIYFPHPRGDENHHIILEYNRDVFPERLLLEQANIATAENKYNTRVPIPLEQVFNTRLEFKMKNYEAVYFLKETPQLVDKIIFAEIGDRLNLLVSFIENEQKLFKVGNQRLRYQLPYTQIDTLNADVRGAYKR